VFSYDFIRVGTYGTHQIDYFYGTLMVLLHPFWSVRASLQNNNISDFLFYFWTSYPFKCDHLVWKYVPNKFPVIYILTTAMNVLMMVGLAHILRHIPIDLHTQTWIGFMVHWGMRHNLISVRNSLLLGALPQS